MSRKELDPDQNRDFDLIIVSGDAYVDHPSFGVAVIARFLEAHGFAVGIIAQPDWKDVESFRILGRPKLAWLVTSGAIDSMVAHYSVSKRPRRTDSLSPGGRTGARPDRAVITYTSRIRQAYKDVPVILGGIEASLRRLSHYDYWSDTVRKSVLLDAKADMIVYGMAEQSTLELCSRLRDGEHISYMTDIRGTVFRRTPGSTESGLPYPERMLPPWDQIQNSYPAASAEDKRAKRAYAESVQQRMLFENPMKPTRLVEHYGFTDIVQNPPSLPLSQQQMDEIYNLSYTRRPHPSYRELGEIPALKEVSFSITSTRGCFGGCSFCAITSHQGRIVQGRSSRSIVEEARNLTEDPAFKGYIHDVGGPTANFRLPACKKQLVQGPCEHRECLFPEPCPSLQDDHDGYFSMLREIQAIRGVKKVFIRSGIRYDYLLHSGTHRSRKQWIRQLCEQHVSGQLKVAPEHACAHTLDMMGKPSIRLYEAFSQLFFEQNRELGKKQFIIPYFITSHPGTTLDEAVELAVYVKRTGFIPDQVQDFYPTPSTVATCMYYTGLDPRPGRGFEEVYIPKGREKTLQRALIHFHKPENYKAVREALKACSREDLIGNSPDCLIREFSSGKRRNKRNIRAT
jgi:uncharacterized radical SAM protein YgiQ